MAEGRGYLGLPDTGDRMSGVFKLLFNAVTKQISSAYLAVIGFHLNKTRFSARLASCAATSACISQAYYVVNCWKGVTVMQNKTDLNKCKTPLRFWPVSYADV